MSKPLLGMFCAQKDSFHLITLRAQFAHGRCVLAAHAETMILRTWGSQDEHDAKVVYQPFGCGRLPQKAVEVLSQRGPGFLDHDPSPCTSQWASF